MEKDPFQVYPVPTPVRPWLGQARPHTYDLNRAEDSERSESELVTSTSNLISPLEANFVTGTRNFKAPRNCLGPLCVIGM
jgi:hypothetical protein